MNNFPKFTVVVPLFNNEKYIYEAIQSVLHQTLQSFEVLVINDGSSDRGPDIARSICDNRIQVVDQINQGVSSARNFGINLSRSEYIAFLDSDDFWEPHFLDTILVLIAKYPECQLFSTNYNYLYNDGSVAQPTIKLRCDHETDFVLTDYFEQSIVSDPIIWTSATAVSRSAILSIGGFPEGVRVGEDLLTWAKLILEYKAAYSTECCALFRRGHHGSPDRRRFPDPDDYVGKEFIRLYNQYGGVALKKYIAHWYKMRTSIYLQLGDRAKARSEIIKSCKYYPSPRKFFVFLFLTILPIFISDKILKAKFKYKNL